MRTSSSSSRHSAAVSSLVSNGNLKFGTLFSRRARSTPTGCTWATDSCAFDASGTSAFVVSGSSSQLLLPVVVVRDRRREMMLLPMLLRFVLPDSEWRVPIPSHVPALSRVQSMPHGWCKEQFWNAMSSRTVAHAWK